MAGPTLNGSWSGAYRYPDDAFPETVFEAEIEELGAIFTGRTREPNLLQGSGEVVTADIDGRRDGLQVEFTKFTDGSGGMTHAIFYAGEADAKLTRIDGVWRIPGEWSGRFFMTRTDAGGEIAAERVAEVTAPSAAPAKRVP